MKQKIDTNLDRLKDMPHEEQLERLKDIINYLVMELQDMRDMNRESETPLMKMIQSLHLRTCALEQSHRGHNLPAILGQIKSKLSAEAERAESESHES